MRTSRRLLLAASLLASVSGCTAARPGVAPVRAGRAHVNGTHLFYETRGSGPALVLVHGGNLDHRTWEAQARAFAGRYRVIRYDVRGFGRSGSWEPPHQAHGDLRALLQHLGIRKAHLVGLSLGGRIALDLAVEHPEMVSSLALAGPGLSGFSWSAEGTEWMAAVREAVQAGDSLRAAEAWLTSGYMAPAMEQPALVPALRRLATDNARVWMHRSGERPLVPPAIGRLGEIRVPTLLIVGSRDVPDIHRIVDTLLTGVPGARRVTLEGVGHMPNMEDPVRFNRAVLDFLGRVR